VATVIFCGLIYGIIYAYLLVITTQDMNRLLAQYNEINHYPNAVEIYRREATNSTSATMNLSCKKTSRYGGIWGTNDTIEAVQNYYITEASKAHWDVDAQEPTYLRFSKADLDVNLEFNLHEAALASYFLYFSVNDYNKMISEYENFYVVIVGYECQLRNGLF
jgi:hypothetical protein